MGRACSQFCQSQTAAAALVALTIFLPTISALAAPQTGEELIDRIVAIVNSEPILYSEVDSKIKRGQDIILSAYPAPPTSTAFEKSMQDEINFELVIQKMQDLEVEIDDGQLDAEIEKFVSNRKLTMDGLKEALFQQGVTYESYRRDFRNQMIVRRFQGRVINPLIKITDKDVETYYLKKTGTTSDNVRLNLRQIFISVPAGSIASVADGQSDRAREVHKKLVNGMDFAEAAKIYSDAPGATENGGKMGRVKLNELAEVIRTEVGKLATGAFTSPIKAGNGYYIFYLEKKSFSGSDDFVRQKRQLEYELRSVEMKAQTERWLAEQRRRSKVKVLPN